MFVIIWIVGRNWVVSSLHADSKKTENTFSPQKWNNYMLTDKLIIRTMKQAIESQVILSAVQSEAESWETTLLKGRRYQ